MNSTQELLMKMYSCSRDKKEVKATHCDTLATSVKTLTLLIINDIPCFTRHATVFRIPFYVSPLKELLYAVFENEKLFALFASRCRVSNNNNNNSLSIYRHKTWLKICRVNRREMRKVRRDATFLGGFLWFLV